MHNVKRKTPLYFILIFSAASCALRFIQLYKYTDESTGLLTDKSVTAFIIYALIAAIVLLGGLYASKKNDLTPVDNTENIYKGQYLASLFTSVAFFADFIHQTYNCYDCIVSTDYMEYTYVVTMAFYALTAILSSFYFMVFSLTAKGTNYDFRSFTLLHFAPVAWCFSRLVLIMLKIVDVRFNVEVTVEFILLSLLIMFYFCCISMVDNNGRMSRLMAFFAVSSLALSAILVLPRFAMLLIGRAESLSQVGYTGLTYLSAGLFAVSFFRKAKNKN